ncbi:glutamyl-tRNA(Gln) amidotransferase subunit A [Metarhizium album ARSEF 1941]|uniref:Glutamyl-tRNA(Gln) amidotransferase subunit A n=1 Tax=Metarhizium album (strain ARSEF 1941) TaxID=1081103 RepID=A0A0B2WU18_METAS|nr:glutamyl-tRNA(Gln) amidotransferase subunit A [Metarhizium album ARSEF 1941]KHN96415.1 glutamyl-tRNA(Gln) amidotransferase subunit A [Metarhizium album ARSEF 1941]
MIPSTALRLGLGVCSVLPQLGLVSASAIRAELPSLLDATLDELRQGLDAGLFTSVDLTKAYIARIKDVADDLHAVNEINPEALSIAADMDAARADGTKSAAGLGPLHGIPVLLKDNIATLDRMNTTAGSFALVGAQPKADSTVAAKLRHAGAIILGKTNLSQWAGFRAVTPREGWSAYGGQTKGAYLRHQNPLGSSSGSAVSASIGLAWAALGTETDASLILPANANNVVAIKPSVGLTSRYLVVPISEHHDTVGPLARTVKDAAHLLAAIAGPDINDNYTFAIPAGGKLPDYVAACRETGLQGKRLGLPRDWLPPPDNDTSPMRVFEDALEVLRSQGATVVDTQVPVSESVRDSLMATLGADMLSGVARYFGNLRTNPYNITTLKQLQDFTQGFPQEDWPAVDTGLWQDAIDQDLDNTSPEFWSLYEESVRLAGPQGLLGALRNNSLDAIVVPTTMMSFLPAVVGSPIITVPLGNLPAHWPETEDDSGTLVSVGPNLPFGIAFAGDLFSEEKLIEIAYAFEQKTKARGTVRPLVKPKTDLRDVVGQKD